MSAHSSIIIQPCETVHLIYPYLIEQTGIREAFQALFKSYLTSDEFLKLNRTDDSILIDDLTAKMHLAFPKPIASIAPSLDDLRLNAYWRLFGYTIKGKENFSKVGGYNAEFNKTLEDIFFNIAQGILDKGITIEKVANPDALAMLLNDLRRMLIDRTYNQIEDIATYWFTAFQALRGLLNEDKLMVDRLGIRATTEDRRLIQLGEKMKVSVAKETMYLYQLAPRMSTFLKDYVEVLDWDSAKAAELYTTPENEAFFKEVFNAWAKTTGKDILAEALKGRRRP